MVEPKKAFNPFVKEQVELTKEQCQEVLRDSVVSQKLATENPALYATYRKCCTFHKLLPPSRQEEVDAWYQQRSPSDEPTQSELDKDALAQFPEREFVKMVYGGSQFVRGKTLQDLKKSNNAEDQTAYANLRRAAQLHKVLADAPEKELKTTADNGWHSGQ